MPSGDWVQEDDSSQLATSGAYLAENFSGDGVLWWLLAGKSRAAAGHLLLKVKAAVSCCIFSYRWKGIYISMQEIQNIVASSRYLDQPWDNPCQRCTEQTALRHTWAEPAQHTTRKAKEVIWPKSQPEVSEHVDTVQSN